MTPAPDNHQRGDHDRAVRDPEECDLGERDVGERDLGEPDIEERDPGLAQERTSLAWTRTAISFAALGGTVLKANVVTGLIILALAPIIWQLGRMSRRGSAPGALPAVGAARIRIIAISIVGVSLLCLVVALLGHAVPGALR